LVVFLIVG